MSITIYANTDNETVLELKCDNDHGMLPVVERFTAPFIQAHAKAMAAGWKESSLGGVRCFLCPGCSRKRVMP